MDGCFSCAAERLSLNEEVRLYPSPGANDPYTLFYDIKVASPGIIRVGAQVLRVSPDKDIPRRLIGIGLMRKGEKKTIRQDLGGKDGGKFEYSVDALELEKTKGEYRIIVSNFSRKHNVLAKLVARYPGEDTGAADMPAEERKSDLAVESIRLDGKGFITVAVKNVGDSFLPLAVWTEKGPRSTSILLEIDGKSWGGVTIWAIDPERTLRRPGSRIVYTSNYRVTRPVKVRAVVDKTRQLNEKDERNNVKEVVLQP